jgi:hypothetical protein
MAGAIDGLKCPFEPLTLLKVTDAVYRQDNYFSPGRYNSDPKKSIHTPTSHTQKNATGCNIRVL